jgi:hypothetical protein
VQQVEESIRQPSQDRQNGEQHGSPIPSDELQSNSSQHSTVTKQRRSPPLRSPLHPITPNQGSPYHNDELSFKGPFLQGGEASVAELPVSDRWPSARAEDSLGTACSDVNIRKQLEELQRKYRDVKLENDRLKTQSLKASEGGDLFAEQLALELQATMQEKARLLQKTQTLEHQLGHLEQLNEYLRASSLENGIEVLGTHAGSVEDVDEEGDVDYPVDLGTTNEQVVHHT